MIPNRSKTSCTNSVYGFIRQVRRRSNPNKETLIYIPYAPCYRNPSVYNPNYKTNNKLLISTLLLLLLVLPIYLGMCPSIPTHMHSYMRKLRLLLETNDEIMCYVYSGSVHAQGGSLLVYEPATRPTGSGSQIMPDQECNRRQGVSALLGHLEALRQIRKFQLHNITNTIEHTHH